MRKNPETIKLAKIRRLIREICRRYRRLTKLEYPDCFRREEEEVEKTAKKILKVIK